MIAYRVIQQGMFWFLLAAAAVLLNVMALGDVWGQAAVAETVEAAEPSLLTSTGRVAEIDLFKRKMMVEEKMFGMLSTGRMKEFVINAQTDIVGGDDTQPLRLNDLAPGDSVQVTYAVEANKNIAHMVLRKDSATEGSESMSDPAEANPPTSPEAQSVGPSNP